MLLGELRPILFTIASATDGRAASSFLIARTSGSVMVGKVGAPQLSRK
jgi:hypothetical protein